MRMEGAYCSSVVAVNSTSMIDFCIVSSDLFSDVLDVQVKRGAELSADHHLVVCSLQLSKAWPNSCL